MSALYILILVSFVVAVGFLAAYIWAVRGGQYDDTCTPSWRILMDEPPTSAGREEAGPDVARVPGPQAGPGRREARKPSSSQTLSEVGQKKVND
jgi:cbb3-type cytochrome oxidase maturation protein